MNRVLVACFLLLCVACGNGKVMIEFRLAETEPTAGLAEFVLPGTGETFYLHNEVAIGNADVASAAVIQNGRGPVVELMLTQEGAARLAEFTEANLKKRVGIVVDGKLASAPLIQAPITGGRAILQGDFSEDEALRIAQALRDQVAER